MNSEEKEVLPLEDLPRLLYIGDVPVESSYHGSALIYRLLQNYPLGKLCIVEAGLDCSQMERRLENAQYQFYPLPLARLQNTRFNHLYTSLNLLWATSRVHQFQALMTEFKPEAIMTVTHGASWITAARLTKKYKTPLHLLCHDDWVCDPFTSLHLKNWKGRIFGKIYRTAVNRFCVSPFMSEKYERLYGATGTVLYPSRDPNTPVFNVTKTPAVDDHIFTVAYAGSFATRNYVQQLVTISHLLEIIGGRLLLFGPINEADLLNTGINVSHVSIGGMLSSAELVQRLNKEADVLFLPMSFEEADLDVMATGFPSKLTDYTAAGLPLLIWGPESSSAVKWAADEPNVAAVVTKPESELMAEMLRELKENCEWRRELAAKSIEVGNKYFHPNIASETFYSNLIGSSYIKYAS